MKVDLAIIPGSFKPPHAGHLDMIKQYASKAKEVLVLISDPKTSGIRTVNDEPINPSDVVDIFELYIKAEKLNNVVIKVSEVASPVKATYDFIESNKDKLTYIVGASKKASGNGLDCDRWKTIQKYMEIKNPNATIIDPTTTAVDVQFNMSSQNFREDLENDNDIDHFLPESVTNNKDIYNEVIDILNEIG